MVKVQKAETGFDFWSVVDDLDMRLADRVTRPVLAWISSGPPQILQRGRGWTGDDQMDGWMERDSIN